MSFADKVAKIADMHEWEKDYYEWLKQPPWVRYADTLDDKQSRYDLDQPETYHEVDIKPSTPQLAKIFKLMDTGRIPF